MRHRRAIWTALGLAILIAIGSATWYLSRSTALPPPKPPPPPGAVVSLGDSTVSGEGAPPYVAGTDGQRGDWCHRSADAEIMRTHVPGVTKRINLACSGARSADFTQARQDGARSQVQRLGAAAKRYRVKAVLVGIGANDDPDFSGLVTSCVGAWLQQGAPCTANFDATWRNRVDAMVPKVTAALESVRSTMRSVGYADGDYQLVVQGYAAPVGPGMQPALQKLSGCPLTTTDVNWLHGNGIDTLNAGVRRAADAADARYLDLGHAGDGHEACGRGPEWFTRLSVNWQDLQDKNRAGHAAAASFHPNAAGHAAFARCLSAFLATDHRDAACRQGPDGALTPVDSAGHE
jgi:lysophospholipase L1-like esterase